MSRSLAIVRVAAILVGGAIAFWIATGVTLNLTRARQAPAFVSTWWPSGVMAKVAEGRSQLLSVDKTPPAVIDRTRASLRQAALREPLNAEALATLAALDEYRNDTPRARALFRASEAVSRRNTLAQLWLIEDAVARGDIVGAVRHYNRAMLVSNDARATLIPVLVAASSDPAILREVLPLLARRPLWWKAYMMQLATNGDSAAGMAATLRATRPNIGDPDDVMLAQDILRRMIAIKGGKQAMLAANRLEKILGSTRGLSNGRFEAANGLLPFAWSLRDEPSIRAYRDTVPNGSTGLRIVTTSGASGGVAQQLVGLAPGRHIFQGSSGNVSADPTARSAINVSCETGKPLSRFVPPASGAEGQHFRFDFEVPAMDCPLQWVTIVTAPAVDTDMWLDDLVIDR